MSGHSQTSLLIILSILIPFSQFIRSSQACGVPVYFGRFANGQLLSEACATGKYKSIALGFLTTFGSGQDPVLDLRPYCHAPSGSCRNLGPEIQACQNQGVKVLLSLGGSEGSYNLSSPQNARLVANYLWHTYLSVPDSGTIGPFRPLGDVPLDGVDFDIQIPGSTLYWDELARALSEFSTPERKIYLSAAPQCPDLASPVYDTAITAGLFDYVWVKYYNNPQCDYSGGILSLFSSWISWSSYLPEGGQLFLGLPAGPNAAAAGSGYIPPNVLVNQISPVIKNSPNYGGVMLWNNLYDVFNGYSDAIYPAVCDNTLNRKESLISQVV